MFFQENAKVNENSTKGIKKVIFAKKAKQLQKIASVEVQPVKEVVLKNKKNEKKSKKESERVVKGINMADQIKKNEELATESSEQKVHS